MTARIRKGHPIRLPPHKWGGDAASWAGRVISAANKDLPVAYLRAHLQELGCTLHYVSPNAAGAGAPLRVPCVLLGGEPSLISSLTGELKQRADKLGLIHASLFNPPIRGGTYPGDMLAGTPTQYGGSDQEALDPPTYLGGRVLVLFGVFDGGAYLDTVAVEEYEYDAQPGSDAECEQYTEGAPGQFTAGMSSLPTVSSTSGPYDLENNGPIGSRLTDDADLLEEAAERFDKFRVWYKTNEAGVVTYNRDITCFDNFIGADTVATTDQATGLSSGAYAAAANAATDQVVAEMGGHGARVDGDPSAEAVLAFFESE